MKNSPQSLHFGRKIIWYFNSRTRCFISSIPSLDLPCVVVGWRGAGELDGLAVQRSVSEQVTEILKQLQQLVRGVLKDGQHLRRHHVVDNKERRLWEKGRGREDGLQKRKTNGSDSVVCFSTRFFKREKPKTVWKSEIFITVKKSYPGLICIMNKSYY